MEIVAYELHVKTHHSVGEILSVLKSKGMEPDLEMTHESVNIELRNPSTGKTHEFGVKLYKEYDGHKIYEFKAHTEDEMMFLRDAFKNI